MAAKPQPGDLAKVKRGYGPLNTYAMYLPRWVTDHHPWVQTPPCGIRYANFEVEEKRS